jgi:glycosyltransferase involved in cell wall biosynthesis
VVGLLSSATAGLIPLLHFGSHEMALTNKLFEYLHARIPVLVSDCRAQARFVQDAGVGEVFTAEDADSLARAATAVVTGRAAYVASITDDLLAEYSWARQEEHLRDLYRDLLGAAALRAEDDLVPLPDGAMVPTAGTA